MRIRNRLAHRLHEPQLKKIRLYDLRHYFATMLYRRTKGILIVKAQLGHKRVEHTLVYIHLIEFRDDEHNVRIAGTVDEATKLIEAGLTSLLIWMARKYSQSENDAFFLGLLAQMQGILCLAVARAIIQAK